MEQYAEDVRWFLVFYYCAVWMLAGSYILCEKSQRLKECFFVSPGVTSEIMRSIVKNMGLFIKVIILITKNTGLYLQNP